MDTKDNSNTAGGSSLSVNASSAVINEVSDDLTLKDVTTTGDFVLTVPGNVYDGNGTLLDDAANAKDAVDKSEDKVDEIETDVRVYEELIIPPLE